MDESLLDTDILSEILKQRHRPVVQRAAEYLRQHGAFAFSALTRFEITRGHLESGATRKSARFASFCQHSLVLPVTDVILDRAARQWVIARRQGHAHSDADLNIAATALEHERVLVTANSAHFDWMPGLTIDNWREPG